MNKDKRTIHPKALQVLMNHDWPGNIRELQNIIERIVALHAGDTITEKNIVEYLNTLKMEEEYDFMDFPYDTTRIFLKKDI